MILFLLVPVALIPAAYYIGYSSGYEAGFLTTLEWALLEFKKYQ